MTTSSPSQPQVAAVSLKLPPYWPDPAIWFRQVEAQFSTRGITTEETRYDYVVAALQPDIAQDVRDIFMCPPATHPYSTLKHELIKRTSESERKPLHQLLTTEELGDRKPSQLLRKMQQLPGGCKLEPSIFRQLFLQRLPTNIQQILASTADQVAIDHLAQLADNILEVSPIRVPVAASIAAVTAPPTSHPTELEQLRDAVDRLTAQVSALSARPRHRSRRRSQSRDRHHRDVPYSIPR